MASIAIAERLEVPLTIKQDSSPAPARWGSPIWNADAPEAARRQSPSRTELQLQIVAIALCASRSR
jgi:hypothetical protein